MNVEFQMSLSPLFELIADCLTKINEADLVRARSLDLILQMVTNHIVTDYHAQKKLMNRLVLLHFLLMVEQVVSIIDLILHCNSPEHHLVGSKSPGFVRQHIVHNSQFFEDTAVEYSALSVARWV